MTAKTARDTVHHCKMIICTKIKAKKPKISRRKFFRESFAKNIGKNTQVKKKL